MTFTVLQIISDVLRELNVLGEGDELEDDDAQRALRYFRMFVDSAQADGLLAFTTQPSPFALVPSQQTYTIGAGGNFNTTRPVFIPHIGVVPVGQTYEVPVVPYQNREEWLMEPWKAMTDLYPSRFLFESDYPLGKIIVWPVPTTAAQLQIALPQPLTDPAQLTTSLSFPPGYYECYHTGLVVRLARPFQAIATDDQKAAATTAMGRVKRVNDQGPTPAKFDAALVGHGGYDIRSGRYRP